MSQNGDGFRAVAADCPYRKFGALTSHRAGLNVSSVIVRMVAEKQLPILTSAVEIALGTVDNTQKRGPPLASFLFP